MPTIPKILNDFTKGFVTEVNELNSAEGLLLEELNVEILNDRSIRRRKPLSLEDSHVEHALPGFKPQDIITQHEWSNVAEVAHKRFSVQQVGAEITFFDLGATALSASKLPFSINLNNYLSSGISDASTYPIQVESVKGKLFIVNYAIDPLKVTFNTDTNLISVEQYQLKIRDFTGIDDGIPNTTNPTTLTTAHQYNLRMRGWVSPSPSIADPIVTYYNDKRVYPSKAQQWVLGLNNDNNFDPNKLDKLYFGDTAATGGHYIVNPFRKDYSAVSGVAEYPPKVETGRPSCIAKYAGRLWYAKDSTVYFSQVLTDMTEMGKCYQEGDPTSDQSPDLLDSDGGVIPVTDVGEVLQLIPFERFLVILGTEGIRALLSDSGFKATDVSVRSLSDERTISTASIVRVGDLPMWWGESGIYSLTRNQVADLPTITNLSKEKIRTFYANLPTESKRHAKGVYSSLENKVYWFYASTPPINGLFKNKYDSVLVLDLTYGSFNKYSLDTNNGYFVCGALSVTSLTSGGLVDTVSADSMEVLSGSDAVVISSDGGFIQQPSTLKLTVLVQQGDTYKYTYGEFKGDIFKDWGIASYESYITPSHYLEPDFLRQKGALYLYSYFRQTEENYVDTPEGYVFDKPSGCFMQSRFAWATSAVSNKFSILQKAYRFLKQPFVNVADLSFDTGYKIVHTRLKINGMGPVVQIKYLNDGDKDFHLLGYALIIVGNSGI